MEAADRQSKSFIVKNSCQKAFAVKLLTKLKLIDHLSRCQRTPVQVCKLGEDEFMIEFQREPGLA